MELAKYVWTSSVIYECLGKKNINEWNKDLPIVVKCTMCRINKYRQTCNYQLIDKIKQTKIQKCERIIFQYGLNDIIRDDVNNEKQMT
jgi:hypothetical protein